MPSKPPSASSTTSIVATGSGTSVKSRTRRTRPGRSVTSISRLDRNAMPHGTSNPRTTTSARTGARPGGPKPSRTSVQRRLVGPFSAERAVDDGQPTPKARVIASATCPLRRSFFRIGPLRMCGRSSRHPTIQRPRGRPLGLTRRSLPARRSRLARQLLRNGLVTKRGSGL